MNLTSFYDLLGKHDWFYAWSDDGGVYRSGEAQHHKLNQIATQSPEHQKLLDEYTAYVFSGEAFGTETKPKPRRPE
jgi:hypothetical protein